MKRCGECKRNFPDRFIQPLFTNGGVRPMCPICALIEINSTHGLPIDTPFRAPKAKRLHQEAVTFVKSQAPQQ